MRSIFTLFFFTISTFLFAQEYTRKDSLRGELTSLRTCYDVTFYDLDLAIDEQDKSIERSTNTIHFTALSDFSWFQIDLASNMEIMLVEFEGKSLDFSRDLSCQSC